MSKYLDELIRRIEVEAEAQRVYLAQFGESTKGDQRRSSEHLNRLLQRLQTLRDLRSRDKRRATTNLRKKVA